MRGKWIERVLLKLWSRKFWVLILATVGLYMGKLDSWAWVAIAGIYIGSNVIQKLGIKSASYWGPRGE